MKKSKKNIFGLITTRFNISIRNMYKEEERRRRSTHHLGRTSSAHVAGRCYDYTHTHNSLGGRGKVFFFSFFLYDFGAGLVSKTFRKFFIFPAAGR